MSQTFYGGPLDDWASRTVTIRDGVVHVETVMKAKIGHIEGTVSVAPPPPGPSPPPKLNRAQRRGRRGP